MTKIYWYCHRGCSEKYFNPNAHVLQHKPDAKSKDKYWNLKMPSKWCNSENE